MYYYTLPKGYSNWVGLCVCRPQAGWTTETNTSPLHCHFT